MVEQLRTNDSGKKAPEALLRRKASTIPRPEDTWEGTHCTGAVAKGRGMQLVPKLKPTREGTGGIKTIPFPPTLQCLVEPSCWPRPVADFSLPGDKDQGIQ